MKDAIERSETIERDGWADLGSACRESAMPRELRSRGRALALGCDRVFTETGMPVQGEPGSSYRNMLRAGFDELYVRDNFAPEGTRWQNHRSSDANARSAVSRKPSRMLSRVTARSGT